MRHGAVTARRHASSYRDTGDGSGTAAGAFPANTLAYARLSFRLAGEREALGARERK